MTVLAEYFKRQITKLGVTIRLGEKFTPALLQENKIDAVILATGGIYSSPKIPGLNGNAVSLGDLYSKMKDDLEVMDPEIMRGLSIYWQSIGKRVLIIDGGSVEGLTLAEYLSDRGRVVTLVDTGEILLNEPPMDRRGAMKNVTVIPEVKYEEITGKELTVTTKDGKRVTIEADTIITASSPSVDTELVKALEGKVPEVYLLGFDAKEPGSIMNAIGSGYRVARAI